MTGHRCLRQHSPVGYDSLSRNNGSEQVAQLPPGTVTVLGDSYLYSWADGAITIRLSRIRDGHTDITAEVSIETQLDPSPGTLEWGRISLSTISQRTTLAKNLRDRVSDFDWVAALLQAAKHATAAHRAGEPCVDLRTVAIGDRARWLLWPYIEFGGPTVIYADGGSGKSYLALAMMITLQTGRELVGVPKVPPTAGLYLDWETDKETVAERLQALWDANNFGFDMPRFAYRRMSGSLADAANEIKAQCKAEDIGCLFVDSLFLAAGDDLNESSGARAYFDAVRYIGVPSLAVTHVSKSHGEEGRKSSAYGSIFWRNGCRLMWEIQKAQQEGSNEMAVKFIQRKQNNVGHIRQHGYSLCFRTSDPGDMVIGVTVQKQRLTDIPEFSKDLPWSTRITDALSHGHLGLRDMAVQMDLATDADIDRLQSALTREKRKGTIINLPDSTWGLASR